MAEYNLVIPDPDRQNVPPIYEGNPAEVHKRLMPGIYKAFIEDWDTDRQAELTVTVTADQTFIGAFTFGAF
ncbi:MAG TPA: hypothetical protein VIY48_18125 [Candidatus Paceibacterota bacterium]